MRSKSNGARRCNHDPTHRGSLALRGRVPVSVGDDEGMNLLLEQIRMDGGTQSRAQLDWVAIDEYAGAMREGASFPPIVVFCDGTDYWLADGFHRVQSAEKAGLGELAADVRQGTKRDAILYSVSANSDHGVRRTNRDKRQAVDMLLKDEEWAEWGDPKIAIQCGVANSFVWRMRQVVNASSPKEKMPTERKVTRNGKTYTQDTTNIGKSMPKPEPAPQAPLYRESVQPKAEPEPKPEPTLTKVEIINRDLDRYDAEAKAEVAAWSLESRDHEQSETEPLPQAPSVVVINGDAQYLGEYINDPVHLIVTSPPYNVGIDYDQHNDNLSTYIPFITSIWRECHNVMVDGARIAVVVPFGIGRDPYIPFDSQIMQTLLDAGFSLRGRIVWDKKTAGNRTSWGSFRLPTDPGLRDTTECIIVAHKGQGHLDIPAEHRYRDEKGSFSAWMADSTYFMDLTQDHWEIMPESATRVKHPAPFPTELVRRLIHFYGFPGCHVVDPFGGSGTVGVVAKELGCQATLFDISQDYCRLAEERIHG